MGVGEGGIVGLSKKGLLAPVLNAFVIMFIFVKKGGKGQIQIVVGVKG